MTVPPGALAGMVKLRDPEANSPVSKATPPTAPGLKAPGADSLVTECSMPSAFTTVTVAPGGTERSVGE